MYPVPPVRISSLSTLLPVLLIPILRAVHSCDSCDSFHFVNREKTFAEVSGVPHATEYHLGGGESPSLNLSAPFTKACPQETWQTGRRPAADG